MKLKSLRLRRTSGSSAQRSFRKHHNFFWPALFHQQKPDALQQVSGRKRSLGEEEVGLDFFFTKLDLAGKQNGRSFRRKLLDFRDQPRAVAFGHEVVAEHQIDSALPEYFESLAASGAHLHFIPTGLEHHLSNRESLFIVIHAKNGLFRPHCTQLSVLVHQRPCGRYGSLILFLFFGWANSQTQLQSVRILGGKKNPCKVPSTPTEKSFAEKNPHADITARNQAASETFSEQHLALHHDDGVTAHAHVYNFVTLLVRAHINSASALHLHALLQQRLYSGSDGSMPHGPCDTGASRGAGCRVFSAIKNHPRLQRGPGVHSFSGDKIKKLRVRPAQILLHGGPQRREGLEDFQRRNRNNRKGIAGAHGLNWEVSGNVLLGDSGGAGHGFTRMGLPKLGLFLCHQAKGQAVTRGEAHGNFADVQIETNFFRLAIATNGHGRAQRGMSGEGQLFIHGEDAHAHAALALRGRIARKDERGFGEIHLAGQRLHLLIAESGGIGEHGKLVALERRRGKNIELDERQSAFCV